MFEKVKILKVITWLAIMIILKANFLGAQLRQSGISVVTTI